MANAHDSRRSEGLTCFRASYFSKFPMAGTLTQVCICLLLVALPFASAADTHGPNQHTLRERASMTEEDAPASPWSNFLSKLRKPFLTVDSALHLIRGNSNGGRGVSEMVPVVTQSTKRPDVHASLAPLMMYSTDKGTPNEDSPMSPISSSTAAPVVEPSDVSVRNLKRLTEDPCGISLGNVTEEENLASPGQFPWMALLRHKAKDSTVELFCGGTLINDRYILTAASCLDIPEYTLASVRLGEYNLDIQDQDCTDVNDGLDDVVSIEACYGVQPVDYSVSSAQAHPKYDPDIGKNNIGLIRLEEKVRYTDLISPVCLPLGDVSIKLNDEKVAKNLILAGWGSNIVPNQATVARMDPADCEDAIGATVYSGQLCAGGSFCHGEVGGALVTLTGPLTRGNSENSSVGGKRFVQLALLSSNLGDCVDYPPSIFTSVQRYLRWILATIKP